MTIYLMFYMTWEPSEIGIQKPQEDCIFMDSHAEVGLEYNRV
jgi:hypothetical protein